METIVFTNGCFDILHPGHIDLLRRARALGTKLIVGINSDRSVREIKGATRPLLGQESRAAILRELRSVDEVLIFDENTPERIIKEIKPQILVKGGDWQPDEIIGADFVLENGGQVFSIPFKQNISTSQIVEKMSARDKDFLAEKQKSEDKFLSENPRYLEWRGVERACTLITDTLTRGNKVLIWLPDDKAKFVSPLADNCGRSAGNLRIVSGPQSQECENVSGRDDLIIIDADVGEFENLSNLIMRKRLEGCRIMIVTNEKGRNVAGLSDVCIMSNSDNADAKNLFLAAIIFYARCAV